MMVSTVYPSIVSVVSLGQRQSETTGPFKAEVVDGVEESHVGASIEGLTKKDMKDMKMRVPATSCSTRVQTKPINNEDI